MIRQSPQGDFVPLGGAVSTAGTTPRKDPELDGREMPPRGALDALVGCDGVGVVCCVAGRLAGWKGEGEAWLVET